MKTFKKVTALVTAAVMAFAVNASAVVVEHEQTVTTSSSLTQDIAANDDYVCIVDPTTKNGSENHSIAVYKHTEDGLVYWCEITQPIGWDSYVYSIVDIELIDGNTLLVSNTRPQAVDGGTWNFSYIDLDTTEQGSTNTTIMVCATVQAEALQVFGNYFMVFSAGESLAWLYSFDSEGIVTGGDMYGAVAVFDYASAKSWNYTQDGGYAWKTDENGNIELYDVKNFDIATLTFGEKVATLEAMAYAPYAIEVSGNYVAAITNSWEAVQPNYNRLWRYDLTAEPEGGVIAKEMVTDNIIHTDAAGSRIMDMDVNGKLVALYAQDVQLLLVYNLETKELQFSEKMPLQDMYAGYLHLGTDKIVAAHWNGGIDVYDIPQTVTMNVDLNNAVWTEDLSELSVKIEVSNGTLAPVSGNVIFAAYEGDTLVDVSVKPLCVAAGESDFVTTGQIAAATTLKAFYWTADNAPIITTPFVDIGGE